jgi:hypothetical protein
VNNNYPEEKSNYKKLILIYRILVLFSIFESLIAFAILSKNSIPKISLLFGYSAERLVLVFSLILPLLFFAYLLAESFKKRTLFIKINQKISQTTDKTFYGLFLAGVTLVGLALELFILFPTTEYYQVYGIFASFFETFTPYLLLIILFGIQVLGFIIYLRDPDWKQLWSDFELRNLVFGFTILFVTFLYWGILFLQAPVLSYLPHWFRLFRKRPFTLRHLYLFPFLLLIWWGIHLVFSKSLSLIKSMLLLIFLGYAFQFMFGLIAGEGFESIRKSYAIRPISTTVIFACKSTSITDSIKNYESYYGENTRVQTKPPGFLAGHKVFARLTNLLTDSQSEDQCKYNYTRIGSYFFPLLASLVIIPITYLSKNFFKLEYPLLPSLIYILAPNFMIWVMVPDQVVLPLIFLINIVLMYLTIKYDSFLIALGLGVVVYFSTFISFSMLPIIGLFFIWLAAVYVFNKGDKQRIRIFNLILGFILGFGLTYLVFYFTLDYDAFSRFQLAFSHHRRIKYFKIEFIYILAAFVTNTIEYFTWTGIPLFFLVASHSLTSIKKIINKNYEDINLFTFCCVGLYFAMNVLSQTIGEVQRMWIFLSPLIAIIAAAEINNRIKNNHKLAVFLLLVIQFCTAVWHFQFIQNQYQ